MVELANPLVALSESTAKLVERSASSIVSVDGGSRWHSSGIHWRSGIIVTAEEVLEQDENIKLTLPGGRRLTRRWSAEIPPPTSQYSVFNRTDYRRQRLLPLHLAWGRPSLL